MPDNSPDQQKINWKNVMIGVVIGAVLVGLGVAIYFLLQLKPIEPTTTGTSRKATPSAKISTPSAKKDETANWKVYSNKKFDFSLKYPASWFNVTNEEINKVVDEKKYEFSNKSVRLTTTEEINTAVFQIIVGSDLSLFETLNKLKPGEKTGKLPDFVYTKIADLTIGGFPAVRYSVDRSGFPAGVLPMGDEVLLKKSQKTYHFVLIGKLVEVEEKNKAAFNQILSTFRFE